MNPLANLRHAMAPSVHPRSASSYSSHLQAAGASRLLISLALAAFAACPACAQSFADLFNFTRNSGGSPPYPTLMAQGRDGNIYGVTTTGGTHNKGTVFKIGPSGGLTVLYNFDGPHGSTPIGGLTLGLDGNLYGMAELGGANDYGEIFRITPAGAFTVLYNFKGDTDGGLPVSPLIVGADGNFYGTSYPGAAFRMTPAGVVTVLAKTPTASAGPLVQAKDGSFYGVTEFGGKYSAGTVYRVAGSTSTILRSFNGPGGSYPTGGLVEGDDGNFYGTTTAGGSTNAGVIYRITPAGSYSVLVDFDGVHTADGYQSFAGMIAGADGYLYGVTIWGGENGAGVIFRMSTDGDYSVLRSFDVPHGTGAYATPIQHTDGKIFGMTNRGGVRGAGVVYSFTDGFQPFIRLLTTKGKVGDTVGILGKGFAEASSVEFNGAPASFHVISDTYMTATVPSGETGFITVNVTTGGYLTASHMYRVTPLITSVSPRSGKPGDAVSINGNGLIQTVSITVGGKSVTSYTVNSDEKLTFRVPVGAKTGKVVLKTPGGTATSGGNFTVTQ